jgi:hypothetical protein
MNKFASIVIPTNIYVSYTVWYILHPSNFVMNYCNGWVDDKSFSEW